MRLDVKKLTDVGLRRDNNEDSLSIAYWMEMESALKLVVEAICEDREFTDDRRGILLSEGEISIRFTKRNKELKQAAKRPPESIKSAQLLTVCDGMGGHEKGEVASKIIATLFPVLFNVFYARDGGEPPETMRRAAVRLNKAAHKQLSGGDGRGMGTTLVSLFFDGKKAYVLNVGDSRAYLFRDGELTQISKDHSFVQALVDAGAVTEEEAFDHPQKNIITKSMLTDPDVEPDVFEVEPQEGDIFLLCSDGLNDMLRDSEIEEIMRSSEFKNTAKKLVDAALERGGKDNVSVILAKVREAVQYEK